MKKNVHLCRLLFLGLGVVILSSCRSVAFHERGRIQDKIMAFEEPATETHFYQKTYYSREGAIGGIGSSAGGGCGCY